MKPKEQPDCLLSVAEVAEIIGLEPKTIRHGQCGTDELTRIKLGSRVVYSFNEVQNWISRRVEKARENKSHQQILISEKSEQIKRKAENKAVWLRLIK
jgi:predicted DNA-binding transcriptional regulator AlpA